MLRCSFRRVLHSHADAVVGGEGRRGSISKKETNWKCASAAGIGNEWPGVFWDVIGGCRWRQLVGLGALVVCVLRVSGRIVPNQTTPL